MCKSCWFMSMNNLVNVIFMKIVWQICYALIYPLRFLSRIVKYCNTSWITLVELPSFGTIKCRITSGTASQQILTYSWFWLLISSVVIWLFLMLRTFWSCLFEINKSKMLTGSNIATVLQAGLLSTLLYQMSVLTFCVSQDFLSKLAKMVLSNFSFVLPSLFHTHQFIYIIFRFKPSDIFSNSDMLWADKIWSTFKFYFPESL